VPPFSTPLHKKKASQPRSFAPHNTITMDTFFAIDLNNEAIQLERAGKFPEAEAKYLEALRMKLRDPNPNYISIGVTQNALGELYLLMAELEKA